MNDPVRLLDSSHSAATRELLQAGLAERPRPGALRGTALAMGVSAGAMAATATSAAAATAVVSASALSVALKSLAVGTLVGLTLAGGAALVGSLTTRAPATVSVPTPPPPSPPAVQRAAESARRRASEPEPEPSVVVASPIAPSPRVPKRDAASATTPSAPASARLPDGQSLSREIALIDGTRRALAAGDAAHALRQLEEYDGRARTGTLDREAQLLHIDALENLGRRGAARALAERYLASYPNDPHAARLRALISAP